MKIQKIELYLNECYSCRSKQFEPLHAWIIGQQLPLTIYKVNRIPLKREWQNLARELNEKYHIKAPFISFEFDDDEVEKQFWSYEDFEKNLKMEENMDITDLKQIWKNIMTKPQDDVQIIKTKKPAKKKTKKAVVKKDKTVTTDVD